MEGLGKRMLQHCGGLPLAITVLAGLLARKDTINEWETVLTNVRVFIGRGKGDEKDYAGVSSVLELSYDDLPYYLKPCFLYIGNCPEDSCIRVKNLTQLWIAEGFICSGNQMAETIEDVAYRWLNELVERCLVQVGHRGSIRKIKTCRLHDLVRDMCLLKATEENFLQIVSLHGDDEATHPFSSAMETKAKLTAGKVRRLAIHVEENVDNLVSKDEIDDRIRSLLYFNPKKWSPKSTKLIHSLFMDFKLLRVLKVEWMRREIELPNEIGNMMHLRYLSLFRSNIKRLPSSVAKLTCLQTLDFRASVSSESPNVVGKMKQLRHLYIFIHDVKNIGKQKLSCLGNLQTLHISSDDFDWTDLTELTNLRKLAIGVSSPLKNMKETLKSASSTLNRIQSLLVMNQLGIDSCAEVTQIVSSCHHIYKLSVNHSTLELPKDPQHYPNLTKLRLWRCDFKDDQIAIVEKLPNLTTFSYYDVTFEENRKTLVCSKGSFPRLQVLCLGASNLDDWEVEEGAMPNLCELSITFWKRLRRVPEGLRYITTLTELNITGMRRTDYSRLQEGGDDFYIIQHVPSLILKGIYDREEDIPGPADRAWRDVRYTPRADQTNCLGIYAGKSCPCVLE